MSRAPFHKKSYDKIVDVAKCYKIGDTITFCRKIFCETGPRLLDRGL